MKAETRSISPSAPGACDCQYLYGEVFTWPARLQIRQIRQFRQFCRFGSTPQSLPDAVVVKRRPAAGEPVGMSQRGVAGPILCHPHPHIWVAESVQTAVRTEGKAGEIPAKHWWAHLDSNQGPLPYQRGVPLACPRRRTSVQPVPGLQKPVPDVPGRTKPRSVCLSSGCRRALGTSHEALAAHDFPANHWWTAGESMCRPPPCKHIN